jgi:hypothetical protein
MNGEPINHDDVPSMHAESHDLARWSTAIALSVCSIALSLVAVILATIAVFR